MKVKCLTQERNTMSLARAQTQTAPSGVERTNHELTINEFENLASGKVSRASIINFDQVHVLAQKGKLECL